MTYSLITHDPESNRFAVVVATCHLAVGAFVPYARAHVGAVATQGETNPLFGSRGLDLLASGSGACATLQQLLQSDQGRDYRQVHVIDKHGQTAAWTGAGTESVAAHRSSLHASVAGNCLATTQVLDAVLKQWQAGAGQLWPERLLGAMRAGEQAGGDKRGRQSAALLIQGGEPYADLELRVDCDNDPLARLEHLIKEARKPYVVSFRQATPCLADPDRTPQTMDPCQPLPY